MLKMKEKLVKNHYKGHDKKIRIICLASLSMMFVAACTFVPLTMTLQSKINEAKVREVKEDLNAKKAIILDYREQYLDTPIQKKAGLFSWLFSYMKKPHFLGEANDLDSISFSCVDIFFDQLDEVIQRNCDLFFCS